MGAGASCRTRTSILDDRSSGRVSQGDAAVANRTIGYRQP